MRQQNLLYRVDHLLSSGNISEPLDWSAEKLNSSIIHTSRMPGKRKLQPSEPDLRLYFDLVLCLCAFLMSTIMTMKETEVLAYLKVLAHVSCWPNQRGRTRRPGNIETHPRYRTIWPKRQFHLLRMELSSTTHVYDFREAQSPPPTLRRRGADCWRGK